MSYLFTKMHGLGNDFVIFDARHQDIHLSPRLIQQVSNRRFGIGCDQVLLLKANTTGHADVTLEIFNADGAPAGACGNGTRCIAWLESNTTGQKEIRIATTDRIVQAKVDSIESVSVEMGKAICQDVDLRSQGIAEAYTVYIGNPHVVIFASEASKINLDEISKNLQHHLLFPNGTNVELVDVIKHNRINMQVWERGVGPTAACGTGACAAAVSGFSSGKTDSNCKVYMPGGHLIIDVSDDLHVTMTGGVCLSYTGVIDQSLFE